MNAHLIDPYPAFTSHLHQSLPCMQGWGGQSRTDCSLSPPASARSNIWQGRYRCTTYKYPSVQSIALHTSNMLGSFITREHRCIAWKAELPCQSPAHASTKSEACMLVVTPIWDGWRWPSLFATHITLLSQKWICSKTQQGWFAEFCLLGNDIQHTACAPCVMMMSAWL